MVSQTTTMAGLIRCSKIFLGKISPKLLQNSNTNRIASTVLFNNYPRSHSSKICSTSIPEFEGKPGINSYEDLHRFSLEDPNQFWGTLAKSRMQWMQDFDQVQDCNLAEGKVKWFLNGKLNVSGKNIIDFVCIFDIALSFVD